jgi:hypothetical protein
MASEKSDVKSGVEAIDDDDAYEFLSRVKDKL